MKLKILVSTVGEASIYNAVESIKKNATMPYDLIIWYSCIKPYDRDYFNSLTKLTDDVIVSTFNKSVSHVLGSLLIYEKYDYFINVNPDNLVRERFINKLLAPFESMDKVAVSGGIDHNMKYDYILNDPNKFPDEVLMFSRKAVNEVGAHLAAFGTYGHEIMEYYNRIITQGWNVATVSDVADNTEQLHAGRSLHANLDELIDINTKIFHTAKKRQWQGYKWYSDTI